MAKTQKEIAAECPARDGAVHQPSRILADPINGGSYLTHARCHSWLLRRDALAYLRHMTEAVP